MGRYSWNDLIINPSTDDARDAVGKECYFANNPMDCINRANWDSRDAKFTLTYVKDDCQEDGVCGLGGKVDYG